MSDDFMKDIDAAASNGGNLPLVTDPVSEPQQQTNDGPSDNTAHDVHEFLSPKSRPTLIVQHPQQAEEHDAASTEEPATTEQDAPVTEPVKESTDEKPTEDTQASEDKKPYLDRFLKQDAKGNLVTEDGTIIAPAGKARAYFEKIKAEGREAVAALRDRDILMKDVAMRVRKLQDDYKALQNRPTDSRVLRDTGMTEQELREAIPLMKALKDNPLEGVKKLLTQLHGRGIDINSLGVNSALDLGTVREMVTEAVKNSIAAQQATPETQSVQEAQAEVQAFFEAYPEAQKYVPQFAKAKEQFPDMSLLDIWRNLQRALYNAQDRAPKENTAPVTEPPKPAPQPPKPAAPRRVATPQQRTSPLDMSYEELARSIFEGE
jgi:hypothetical protein